MRIVFAGTPNFAAIALGALVEAGHDVVLVLTQPDRPAGRGLQNVASAVKQLASERGLPVAQPAVMRDPALVQQVASLNPDVMVVAAYGLIVPSVILHIPRRGCINIHASLLPRWRGAAPIQRAILAGDPATGITIMQMDEGLDTGPILMQESVPIASDDTAGSLHDKLAQLGGALIVTALASDAAPMPQDSTRATYASKIDKAEARIDWLNGADFVERQVRALNPAPGAATSLNGLPLKIWSASVVRGITGVPGTVCEAGSAGIVVACGSHALRIRTLQRAGSRRLDAAAFLSGRSLAPGARLGD